MSQLFSLTGKKAIVTGATGTLGLFSAQILSSFGAEITLVGRNRKKLESTKKKIHSPHPVQISVLDLNHSKEVKEFFSQQENQDILVNSAGTNYPQSLLEVDETTYDRIMDINIKSAFFQTQGFVAARKAAKKPTSIIHISSQMAYVGGYDRSVYCASKHALEGFCKAAAIEIGPWNIRINTICPTFILTEMTQSTLSDPAQEEKIKNQIVFGRLGEPEEIQGAVIYLASDASSLVTGTTIKVDGGWTAR